MHTYYLLVVDLCSSLTYFMMTQPLPIAGKLPINTLNWLLSNYQQNFNNNYDSVINEAL